MNRYAYLLREIYECRNVTQRELSTKLSLSLGSINNLIKGAMDEGLIYKKENKLLISKSGMDYLADFKVDRAIIMAAGFGSRFVPLTFETPKGLLEVFGERMIERQIKQLHEAGINDIIIVVGYLKEHFDYLIDKYDVKLIFNPDYSFKNNLSTLYHVREYIDGSNVYILSSDNWMRENMYHKYEPYSWYSGVYIEGKTGEWALEFNKRREIQTIHVGGMNDYVMYGPVYFSKDFSNEFVPLIIQAYLSPGSDDWYWENVLLNEVNNKTGNLPPIYINTQPVNQVYEFENLEELRNFDDRYREKSGNIALELIAKVFNISEREIKDLRTLKSGMTNKSFLFTIGNEDYICRIPGKGTDVLINRKNEYDCYMAVKDLHITEEIIYFDRESGYKISKFYKNSRNANPRDIAQMSRCMELLKAMHDKKIHVNHEFNIGERIEYYKELCLNSGGISFEDVETVHTDMMILLAVLKDIKSESCLCHIDSVADNFIITDENKIKLIDWEYAGMAEPIIDVAMCAIYSYYNKEEADRLLTCYLKREPLETEYKKLYSYMALSGYLWALWTVYKANLGEEFGEYSLVMYRYAKDFFKEVIKIG